MEAVRLRIIKMEKMSTGAKRPNGETAEVEEGKARRDLP